MEIEEGSGWVVGAQGLHSTLPDRNNANQHEIESISGLREELDEIESPRVIYSDKFNVANYYKWKNAAYDEYGYFVSLVPEESTITICTGTDIFGVSVNSNEVVDAGFIGGQDAVPRDNTYGLVVTSGLVDVRCESNVNVGDYVICNAFGYAKKADTVFGYKVVATEEKKGVNYATISLGVQSDKTHELGLDVQNIEDRVSVNERNIISAINVANQAYNKAAEAAESTLISEEAIRDALEAILDSEKNIEEFERALESSNSVVAQAKAIAERAVASAMSIKNEAVEKANEALQESSKLRDDFKDISNKINGDLADAVDNLEDLIEDLEPLVTWPEGATGDDIKGIAGFVAKVNEDSLILGTMVGRKGEEGETLAGFIQEAEETRAVVRGITSYTTEDGKLSGAAGLIVQVDDNKSAIDAVVNHNFTKGDGTVVAGLAGLNTYVNENESNIDLISQRISGQYTIVPEVVAEDKRNQNIIYASYDNDTQITTYYYYLVNWRTITGTAGGNGDFNQLEDVGLVDDEMIYYISANQTYWYYDSGIWKKTSDPYVAGLPSVIAGIQTVVDDNSSTINSFTSWQGDTNTAMARIEQKADANGAYIQSTVSNLHKYAVGPSSQVNGFTIHQAKDIFSGDVIYVPTVQHKETYKRDYEMIFLPNGWNTSKMEKTKVYYTSTFIEGKSYYYYFIWRNENWFQSSDKSNATREYEITFTPGYLYKWGESSGEFPYEWKTVDKDYTEITENGGDNTNKVNTSHMAVYFSTQEIVVGEDNNYGYWYTNGDEITDLEGNTGTYKPYTLYKWMNFQDKMQWVAVATLANNSQSRAVSQLRQDSNSINMTVTNLEGAYAGIESTLNIDHAKIGSIAAWPSQVGDDKYNMAIFEEKSDDNGAYMTLATVRNVEQNPNLEEIGGARIVLADTEDGGSYFYF